MNGNGMMTIKKKRLIPWMTKIAETRNIFNPNISNDDIISMLKGTDAEKFLDANKYVSDLNKNGKEFSEGCGFFTKQDVSINIDCPMIFYVEVHVFGKKNSSETNCVALYFKESNINHREFDTSKCIHIIVKEDFTLRQMNSFLSSRQYLGTSWVTKELFGNLDSAIESLENDIEEEKNKQKQNS